MNSRLEPLQQSLEKSESVCLMIVIDSQGSAPGRLGFKMFVNSNSDLSGSIGGGLMEYNMVELAKLKLQQGRFKPFKIKQVHNKKSVDSSGMVCSGSQQIAFYYVQKNDIDELQIENNSYIQFNQKGIESAKESSQVFIESEKWNYSEPAKNQLPLIHLFGAGHVSIPTCKLLKDLGFEVNLYDNRKDLNTFTSNQFAKRKKVLGYSNILNIVSINHSDYIILMNHKYIEDKLLLSQFLNTDYSYCGVLGSKNKIKKMFKELVEEGFSEELLKKVNAPIGLNIKSETPEEIAVSIAAELIQFKNKY